MSPITLFDLPSNGDCACWSPNPWKTRLALNFKGMVILDTEQIHETRADDVAGLDYKTQWVEFPDVESTLSELGIPPNGAKGARRTIPTIRLPSGEYIMDSRKIADILEKEYPEPSLRLNSPVLAQVEGLISKAFMGFALDLLPRVPTLLNPRAVEYFHKTRVPMFGGPLEEVLKEKGGDVAWDNARPHLQELAKLLKEKGGPFFLGESVSYADFYIVAMMQFCKRLHRFDRIDAVDPAFAKLYDASADWLKRDT